MAAQVIPFGMIAAGLGYAEVYSAINRLSGLDWSGLSDVNSFLTPQRAVTRSQTLSARSSSQAGFDSTQIIRRPRLGVRLKGGRSFTVTKMQKRKFSRRRMPIGKLAYRKVRKLERAVEIKALLVDTGATALNLPSKTVVTHGLSTIPQGDDVEERIGVKASLKSLTLNLCLVNKSGDPHCVRVVVAQSVGPALASPNYFGSTAATENLFLCPKSQVNVKRWRTLHDSIVALSAGTTNNMPMMIRALGLRPIEYNSGGVTGEVRLFLIRDEGALGPDVQFRYFSKLTYSDS